MSFTREQSFGMNEVSATLCMLSSEMTVSQKFAKFKSSTLQETVRFVLYKVVLISTSVDKILVLV